MQKFVLFSAAMLFAAFTMAQQPTVAASSITFKACNATNSNVEILATPSDFPVDFRGQKYYEAGTYTVKTINTRGCDSIITLTINEVSGVIPFEYSVSATKKVYFSQGNLQYKASNNSWRFANKQYDVIMAKAGNTTTPDATRQTQSDTIDLFCWATSGAFCDQCSPTKTMYPYLQECVFQGEVELQKSIYDWGWHNAISNGGGVTQKWYTLTAQEWDYVLGCGAYGAVRTDATSKRFFGDVAGVNGMLLLPDTWKYTGSITLTVGSKISLSDAQLTELQSFGAVFMPITGNRTDANVSNTFYGYYWTASCASGGIAAQFVNIQSQSVNVESNGYEYKTGSAVRLVCDADKK